MYTELKRKSGLAGLLPDWEACRFGLIAHPAGSQAESVLHSQHLCSGEEPLNTPVLVKNPQHHCSGEEPPQHPCSGEEPFAEARKRAKNISFNTALKKILFKIAMQSKQERNGGRDRAGQVRKWRSKWTELRLLLHLGKQTESV